MNLEYKLFTVAYWRDTMAHYNLKYKLFAVD